MFKPLTRAFNPGKPADLFVSLGHACARKKECAQRILFWIILSLILVLFAFAADATVARLFTLKSSSFWKGLAIYTSKAGEGWVVALVGAVVSGGLFFLGRFRASRLAFLVALTGLLTGAAATIIRSLVGRTRPDSHHLQGFYGVWHDSHWIIGRYEFGAFPSGHIATVVGLAAAAWLIDRRFGLLAAFYALMVTWSRIALGCHHFSDGVAAGILGIFGANLILTRLGPGIHSLGESLQKAWLAYKIGLGHSGNRG